MSLAPFLVLDVLAQDAEANRYNIEMQVRRFNAWGQRSTFYLARMLSTQLASSTGCSVLDP